MLRNRSARIVSGPAALAWAFLVLSMSGTAAQEAKPPLTITDDTIGILREKQAGSIVLPSGSPPFPAVVVLHGCNGVGAATRQWARRLASWGYAALIVDSFTPRGIENVCGHGRDFAGRERAKDAFAAAAYLRARPDIDHAHIGLVGFSHGGWTALAAAAARVVENNGASPFAAVVAFYPYCPSPSFALASDLQILIGDADDWSPAQRCTDLVGKYADSAPHRPLLKIYPGARHAFDVDQPERLYFGHKLGYDAAAAADSFAVTKAFLDSHLRH